MKAHKAAQRDINRARRQWLAQRPENEEHFEIYPENCVAFKVFWSLRDEWERAGAMGGRFTIPRTDMQSTIHMMGVVDVTDTFERVAIMVRAARPFLIERHNAAIEAQRAKK